METQIVDVDEHGHYSVLLGATRSEGLPMDIFASGEARWLGVSENLEPEQKRVLLISVPYALKAADADTLGGLPPSAYALLKPLPSTSTSQLRAERLRSSTAESPQTTALTTAGSAGYIAKFSDPSTLVDSTIFESVGNIGIGTTTPLRGLHIRGGSGAMLLDAGLEATNPVIFFAHDNFSSPFNDFISANRADERLEFFTKGVLAMTLKDTGLGLGTNAPLERIHIRGGGGAMMLDAASEATNPAIFFSHDNFGSPFNNFISVNRADESFEFFSHGLLAMTVKSTGVGIGTSNPLRGLHIRGGSGAMIMDAGSEATNPVIFLAHDNFGSPFRNFIAADRSDERLDFFTAGSLALTVKNTGIGVGTSAPRGKIEAVDNSSGQASIGTQNGTGISQFQVSLIPPSGVFGDARGTTGVTAGVVGLSSSPRGYGVLGENTASTGSSSDNAIGVLGITVQGTSGQSTGVFGDAPATTGDAAGVFGRSASTAGTGVFGIATAFTGDAVGLYGRSLSTSGAAGLFDAVSTGGDVLVGRVTAQDLNATSATTVFRVDQTGKGFFNGGTQTGGADFAESVLVRGAKESYEPGDVLAIDPTGVRRFHLAADPYSTLVAGIYSTKPGVLATPHQLNDPRMKDYEVPLAIVGIVPCKVSNENGAIKIGDLLVTSSRPGYAMKGIDRSRMAGAVLGKALEDMNAETGIIEILVSLQ